MYDTILVTGNCAGTSEFLKYEIKCKTFFPSQNIIQDRAYVGASLSSTNFILFSVLMLEKLAQASMKEPGQQESAG